MQALGNVKIKYQNETVDALLFDDGTVQLPGGKVIKLKDKQFEALKKQIQKSTSMQQYKQPTQNNMSSSAGEFQPGDLKEINAFQKYDDTAERKYNRKRHIKIFIGILVFIALCVGAYFLIRMKYPELLGLAPNSYKVAVANTDIDAGDTITSDEISYIELSREEYTAQCTDMYMAEDGSMKTDSPIFYVNINNQVVGKFAAENISEGDMIRPSLVTSQVYSGSVTISGEEQDVNMTESELNGETTVEIVAKITMSDGTVQEVPLTSMKLQGKTLTELLDGNGQALLDQTQESVSSSEGELGVQPSIYPDP